MKGDEEFFAFVAPRMDRWRRGAFLICQDWHTADDAVSVAVAKLYRAWPKARKADNVEAYAQRVLTRSCVDELRRGWRKESPTATLPDLAPVGPAGPDLVDERQALAALLRSLGPSQRAVLVLRFYLDYSIEETARILGISEGTVKSQAARGLESVRALAQSVNAKSARSRS